jgi:hypothetical protein
MASLQAELAAAFAARVHAEAALERERRLCAEKVWHLMAVAAILI